MSPETPIPMNYRHAYHAGNHTEMLKHAALVAVLEHLGRKEKPFFVLDTHAGIGGYDLGSEEAVKTGEATDGILRVARADPPAARAYLDLVRGFDPSGEMRFYPGSPEIVRRMLRPQDRLVACELHPADVETLRIAMRHDPRVAVHQRDGYEAIGAFVPPPERRGLVFVDPPFEKRDEADRLGRTLAKAVRKWPTGTYMAWYPLKDPDVPGRILAPLEAAGAAETLQVELALRPLDGTLVGGGLVIVNPPYTLPAFLDALGPQLLAALGGAERGAYRRAWITPPR
jgi:23S rRNA (adenine2030-N6)-methyltransferase